MGNRMSTDIGETPKDLLDALDVLRKYLYPEVLEDGMVDGERYKKPDPTIAEKKMWLIVRKDLNLSLEKGCPQSGHGHLTSWVRGLFKVPLVALAYLNEAQPKITVGVKNETQLLKAFRLCQEASLPCVLIKDAGRTVFPEPTFTVVCVGPCLHEQLPKFVGDLNLLKTQKPKDVGMPETI